MWEIIFHIPIVYMESGSVLLVFSMSLPSYASRTALNIFHSSRQWMQATGFIIQNPVECMPLWYCVLPLQWPRTEQWGEHVPTGCLGSEPSWKHIPDPEKSIALLSTAAFRSMGLINAHGFCLPIQFRTPLFSIQFRTPALCLLCYPAGVSLQGNYILWGEKRILLIF